MITIIQVTPRPCPLATHLARNLDPKLSPTEAIDAALSELEKFEWNSDQIDFTDLVQCAECERWRPGEEVYERRPGSDDFCDHCWAKIENAPDDYDDNGVSDRSRL